MKNNVREYSAPEVSMSEILRYLGTCEDEKIKERIDNCLAALLPTLTYRACLCEFPVSVSGDSVDLGFAEVASHGLATCLRECESAVVFVATVGLGPDRLMARYSASSPIDALIVSAIGNERVESLCDLICDDISQDAKARGKSARPRFSPGYGDLDLSLERDIFSSLSVTAKLGVTLGERMLMTPVKSVSAIVGIRNGDTDDENS